MEAGWIDFEKEISRAIQRLEKNHVIKEVTFKKKENIVKIILEKFLKILVYIFGLFMIIFYLLYKLLGGSGENLFRKIQLREVQIVDNFYINELQEELDVLIRMLEIYLTEYVEKLDCNKISPDIENISVDALLSFNYTHTYTKLYDISKSRMYNYVHGETNSVGSLKNNNMVLGIDEYLAEERKNKDIDFIAFKKYYQRIYKGTGCEYENWVYEIKESAKSTEARLRSEYPIQIPFIKYNNNEKHNLFIFGHSLDITDKDILRELILNDNVYTTIFYHKIYDDSGKDDNGRKDLGLKIANLVKVIGQDELIRRTGGSTKTIEFKLQQDMMERT